jgi:rod shape-determining protein MreB
MIGRTPDNIIAARPLKHGTITDFELCEAMLRYFIRKASRQGPWKPRVVIGVPGEISPVEKRAVFNSAERAGAGRVYLIEKARAASVGAGLPISEPIASMVCDIGSGTTEVAVMSLGEIVSGKSLRVAGDEMDQAIADYIRQHFSMRIGLQSAEQLKLEIGSAAVLDEELTAEVRGLDIASGIPRRAVITSEEVREALQNPLEAILDGIKETIEKCDPELIADMADTGLVLTGGASQLRSLDQFLREQLGIPVRVDFEPATTVARGTAICLEHLGHWRDRLQTEGRGF